MKPLDYYRKQLVASEQALRDHAFESSKTDVSRAEVNKAVDDFYQCLVDGSVDVFEFGQACCKGEMNKESHHIDAQCLPFIVELKNNFAQLRAEELRQSW